jgi:hypothetical protein
MSATTPTTPATRPRRTRTPDLFTNVMLVVSVVFAGWGVGLAVLTLIGIAEPAFIYIDTRNLIKAWGSTVVAVLAVSQTWSMEAAMGHLPRGTTSMRTLMRLHRWGGRIAIVLAALVAIFCMVDRGAPSEPSRVAIHVFFAATAFAALAVKLLLIRFRPALAYDVAPWLGRYIAFAFVVVWVSSGLAYFTDNL